MHLKIFILIISTLLTSMGWSSGFNGQANMDEQYPVMDTAKSISVKHNMIDEYLSKEVPSCQVILMASTFDRKYIENNQNHVYDLRKSLLGAENNFSASPRYPVVMDNVFDQLTDHYHLNCSLFKPNND